MRVRICRASRSLGAKPFLFFLATILMSMFAVRAGAIVVRGRVTDSLGKTVPGARVQLIEAGKVVTITYADENGQFEIRSSDSGRFTLLTSAIGFLPAVGSDFYGGAVDVINQDAVLATNTVRQDVSVSATGIPTPLPQLTAPVSLVPQQALSTRVGVIDELRQTPGVFVVQQGQRGGVGSLFVRGGPSDGNKVLIDGVPAEDVGGSFDFGTVSSTGIANIELYRGPNSALYGTNSQTSVVSITTPRGTTLRPMLTYSGDAGNLHTWRNEAIGSGTWRKLDYLGGFSRFDTSNAVPNSRYHSGTAVANAGYSFNGSTQLRFTIRNADSVNGLPGGYDFYGLAQKGRQGDQDLYSGATLENRTRGDWHNLLRYGIARKREQAKYFGTSGTLLTFPSPFSTKPGATYTGYFGNVVTIRGANGYSATDRAQIFSGAARDQTSNRDELYYQSDYVLPHRIALLFGFRYENERGSSNIPAYFSFQKTQRTNFEYNLQIQGDIAARFFYSFGGSVQKNHLYGIAGEPRIGFAYVPVRPSSRLFRGTRLRFNYAEGVQEPSLAVEFSSLYKELQLVGDTADIAKFKIAPLGPERARTFDAGVDQSILGDRLSLKLGYFHNRFSNQVEYVGSGDLKQYFGISPTNAPYFYGAELNSLQYRAQGLETEIVYQPQHRLLFRGGYTYLSTVVEQSFSGDVTAALGGFPNTNPKIPGVAIGSSSPLIGAREFRRPPHTGFISATYVAPKWSVLFKSSYASRSDDSTFLSYVDPAEANTLLLPNRDLDFGYSKLDLGGTFAVTHRATVFTQVENLLNNQHIGPIGYPGLPLTVRGGVKIRLGGD